MEENQKIIKPLGRSFVKEMCDFNVEARTYHKTLYAAFKKWYADNGWICNFSTIELSNDLFKSKSLYKSRYAGGVIWYGIKLKNNPVLDEVKETFNKTRVKVPKRKFVPEEM